MSEDALSALVVIDYQNIHLTAHERFAPVGLAKHETLVHPLQFANQVLITRMLSTTRENWAVIDG